MASDELLVLKAQELLSRNSDEQDLGSFSSELLSTAIACHSRMLELGDSERPFSLAIAGADLLQALQKLSGQEVVIPSWVAVHEEQCCRYGAIWIHALLQQGDPVSSDHCLRGVALLQRLQELHPEPLQWVRNMRHDLELEVPSLATEVEAKALRLVVVGNCQAHPLTLGLMKALPQAHIDASPSVHLATAVDVARLHKRLKHADFLVMHRVQPGYRNDMGLDSATLASLLPLSARSVVLPNLHYEGHHPWIGYAQDQDRRLSGLENESPLGPYHDFLAMVAARDDLPLELLFNSSCPVAVLEQLRTHHQDSLTQLATRENDCDLSISDWIASNYRHVAIAHTVNHPTQAALDQLLRRLLQVLGLPHELSEKVFDATELLGTLTIPVHPWVRQALGLDAWADKWGQRQGEPLPIERQFEESIGFYRRHPWIASANASHSKLAFASNLLQQVKAQPALASVNIRRPGPRVAALINYFNDVDMLAWQLKSGCLKAYDRIYIWDGPYGYLHQLALFPDEAHCLEATSVGSELLADPRVVYRYRHWRDEAEKRIDAYAAIEEDLVVLHDTDEFFHIDPGRLKRFWGSTYAAGSQRLQNLYAGGLRGSDAHHADEALDALPLKRVLFRRSAISAERHLDYCWLVGVPQQPTDESVVDPEPLGHTYHLTACRSTKGQAAKMAFYMSLSLVGKGAPPVMERLEELMLASEISLQEAQAVFLRGDPGFAGVPNPAFGLSLAPRLHHPDFPQSTLKAMLAQTNTVAAGTYSMLSHYPLQLWIPASEAPQRLVVGLEQAAPLKLQSWLWCRGEPAGLDTDLRCEASSIELILPPASSLLGRLMVITILDRAPVAVLHRLKVELND